MSAQVNLLWFRFMSLLKPAKQSLVHCPLAGTMTTLDDKLLGEKLQYYYSTSEDEDSDHEDRDGDSGAPASSSIPVEAELASEGISINTGTGRFRALETGSKVPNKVCIS